MILDVQFAETNSVIDTNFGEINEVSDGGYDRGYGEGYTAGSDFTRYIKSLYHTFNYATFPEGYELDLTVSGAEDMSSFMNRATGVKVVKLAFVNKGATIPANYAFGCVDGVTGNVLETVDISNAECKFSTFAGAFQARKALKHIIGEIDLSVSINNNSAFYNCYALENVSFKPLSITKTISLGNSPRLSTASIQSIIDGLADLTGGTAQTLTLNSVVKNQLSSDDIDKIWNKNWNIG